MTVRSLVDLLYELPPEAPVAIGNKIELAAGLAARIDFRKIEVDEFSGIVVLSPSSKEVDDDIASVTKDPVIFNFE